MNKVLLIAATLAVLASGLLLLAEEGGGYKVIVNGSSSVSSLSRDGLAKIFLKKASAWPDGSKAFPVDRAGEPAVREAFSKGVLGRSVSAVKTYWQQQIFSGKDVPPPEKNSEAEVIAFVRATPGAVGYISASAKADEVKVLRLEN